MAEPSRPRGAALPAWAPPAAAAALVVAVAAWATASLYGGIPYRFNPWFGAGLDVQYRAALRDGLTWDALYDPNQAPRFVPLTHFTYFAMKQAFAGHWRPHACVSLAGHALFASAVGLGVLAVGRSLAVAIALTVVLATAVPQASGLRYYFAASLHSPVTALMVAAAVLLVVSLRRDSRAAATGVVACATAVIYADPRGLLVLPVLTLFGLATWWSTPKDTSLRRAGEIGNALGVAVWVYGALWVTGIWWWGDPLAHVQRQLASTVPPTVSVRDLLAYALVGWWSPPPLDELPNRLPAGVAARAGLLVGILLALAAALGGACLAWRRWRVPGAEVAAAGLASLAAAAILAWEGARFADAPVSFVRVHGGATAFLALGIGLALCAALSRLPRAARVALSVVILLGAWDAARDNREYVRHHRLDQVDPH